MNSIASSPTGIYCNIYGSCVAMTNWPDWAQAGSIVIAVAALCLGAFLLSVLVELVPILRLIFRPQSWEIRAALYVLGFAPPAVGVAAGGISLVYGIQNAAPGYMIGGGSVLAICLIVLLVLLSNNSLPFWFAIPGVVIGLYLAYYGYVYSVQGLEIGGWVVFLAAWMGFVGLVRFAK